MTHDKDKILIRAKDITMIISIITLLGFLFGPTKKIFQLEQTIEDVREMKIEVNQNKTNIAVVSSQYSDIQKQLEQLNWQMRAMRTGDRSRWRGGNGE